MILKDKNASETNVRIDANIENTPGDFFATQNINHRSFYKNGQVVQVQASGSIEDGNRVVEKSAVSNSIEGRSTQQKGIANISLNTGEHASNKDPLAQTKTINIAIMKNPSSIPQPIAQDLSHHAIVQEQMQMRQSSQPQLPTQELEHGENSALIAMQA